MKRRAALLFPLLAAAQWPVLAQANPQPPAPTPERRALEAAARAEGRIVSVGMPDIWANWRATWADVKRLYGLEHLDLNMSSAEEIEKMATEGRQGTVDIGDVGFEYAAIARGRNVSLAHKPALWEQIPDWAKDADGYWALAYTGTIAFAVNKRRVERVPRGWAELFAGKYTVQIGEVGVSAQANSSVLAAAVALGGSEVQLQPALTQFARLQREGRLVLGMPSMKQMEAGAADVMLLWDFQALAMRERLPRGAPEYEILIPADGSISSGYTPIINRNAPHPNAALLVRDYIFSDAGQLNLARGHARPIRIKQLNLPEALRRELLDETQYAKARMVQPAIWAWEAKKLGPVWQREVLRTAP